MAAHVLKVQLDDDLRRLNMSQLTTYAEFCNLIRQLFNISPLSGLQLSYVDEDEDIISIRSEMDMAEARNFAAALPSFKIQVSLTNGVASPSAPSSEPLYPQLAPEDHDLTSSFQDLMTDSMVKKNKNTMTQSQKEELESERLATELQEAEYRRALDELVAVQEQAESGTSVLTTVEDKFKVVVNAVVEWVQSLKLDEKMKQLVHDLEPSFLAFESRVITPLGEMSRKGSQIMQHEVESLMDQINQLKAKLQQRLEEMKERHAAVAAAAANAEVVDEKPVLVSEEQVQAEAKRVEAEEKAREEAAKEGKEAAQSALPFAFDSTPSAPVQPAPVLPSIEAEAKPSNAEPNLPHSAMEDLLTLESMGFKNRRRNLELLAETKGNLQAVIERLLAESRQ